MVRFPTASDELAIPLIVTLALCAGACDTPGTDAPTAGAAAEAPAVEPVSASALAEAGADVPDDAPDEAEGESGAMRSDTEMDHDAMAGEAGDGSRPVDHSDPDHTHETRAEPFAADSFGGSGDDYGLTFTPDGRTVYFTRAVDGTEAIYTSRRTADGWSEPQVASFSGTYHDKEPYVAADGNRLYFASRRPAGGGGARDDLDLFYVARDGSGGWGEPVHLAETSSPFNEDYPAVAADGTVVFARADADGDLDLWIAHAGAAGIEPPRPFDRPINSVYSEADPWIAPDAMTIVFTTPRLGPEAQGQGDLYVIHRRADGWTPPRTLGFDVNTIAHEYGPVLSPDGATFYFARGFGGELWSVPVTALANFTAR